MDNPDQEMSKPSWQPGKWLDGSRKSAFRPYKSSTQKCVVLTNLQRGNTQADTTNISNEVDYTIHSKAGRGELTKQDINESYVNILDRNGLSLLHWAAFYGQLISVNLLLSYKSINVDIRGHDGETPLLLASAGGHQDIVKGLIKHGANVNHVDDLGNSSLMYAAYGNHPHSCQELLNNGAKIGMTNMSGENAYDMAVKNNSHLGN